MIKLLKNLKSTEFSMKIKEKFFITKKYAPETTAHFNQAMKRFKQSNNLKKSSQIKREIQICKKYWKCYPYHYYTQNLFMADNDLTDDELIDYIPHFYWFKLFLPHYSSPKYSLVGGNKIVMGQFFKSLQVNHPKPLLILLNNFLYSSEMEPVSFDRIRNELSDSNYEKIFVKPVDGSGGRGIYIFHKSDEGHYISRQNIFFDENFLTTIGKKNDYIIQPGIVQDSEISGIYSHSVNSFRIITENKGKSPRIVCAMLRIGRGQKEVDNISLDGICALVNIYNGKLGDFATSYQNEKFSFHPDTHFEFHDKKITRWDEISKFVIESAEKLPFFTYLGWDIALTKTGPIAIETNLGVGIEALQLVNGGLRKVFGIDDPDYYWKNPGYR